MRYIKLCVLVIVAGAILLLGWWCWYTGQKIAALEAKFETHKEQTTYLLAQSERIVELNSVRQTHLENIVLSSQEILSAFQRLDDYNERIPVRYARDKRSLPKALGGR